MGYGDAPPGAGGDTMKQHLGADGRYGTRGKVVIAPPRGT